MISPLMKNEEGKAGKKKKKTQSKTTPVIHILQKSRSIYIFTLYYAPSNLFNNPLLESILTVNSYPFNFMQKDGPLMYIY